MTTSESRPTAAELAAVEAAFEMFLAATERLTDADVRAPSLLPGWSRAHVLSHVARSGEGDALIVEGAIRGEVLDKYPGGDEQRARDIEAGVPRTAAELRADLVTTQARLSRAWSRVEPDMWSRFTRTPGGPRTVAGSVHARRREILVHLVDLEVGVAPADLPRDYVDADLEWLREFRSAATWNEVSW